MDRALRPLADPALGHPATVKLLLCGGDFHRCYPGPEFYSTDRSLRFVQTLFGWTLGGAVPSQVSRAIVSQASQPSTLKHDPEDLFHLLWTQDQIPGESTQMSEDDCLAIDHFSHTHRRLPSGAYSVALPRRLPTPVLGESRSIAAKHFQQNERSLQRRDQWQTFADVLHEYSTMEHVELVPPKDKTEPASDVFYMPVHGVIKATSTSTRLRCVFDASAKSSTGVSLNDQLLVGPTLHPHLTTILSRFRLHAVAISSDISKMFRVIHLLPEEKDLHRFLVRSAEGELQDWRMRRLTFGVASSPFLATNVIRQAASDLSERYPLASAVLRSDFYVDDCLSGAPDVTGALSRSKNSANFSTMWVLSYGNGAATPWNYSNTFRRS